MFELYQEPAVIPQIIQVFSILTNFVIWLTVAYLFRLAYIYKKDYIISHTNIAVFSLVMVVINFLGLNVNIIPIIIAYLFTAYVSWKWIPIKSLKWINISMTLFCLFITCTYVFFNYKIHYISYVFFSSNDILHYEFNFKPYFLIYQVGDFLGSVSYTISGEKISHVNDPLQYRIYMFYYVLHTLGLTMWLLIYFDVLKKHRFTPETAQELLSKHKIIQQVKDKKIQLPLGAIDDMDRTKSILDNANKIKQNSSESNLAQNTETEKVSVDFQNLVSDVDQTTTVNSKYSVSSNTDVAKNSTSVSLISNSEGEYMSSQDRKDSYWQLNDKELQLQKDLLQLQEKKLLIKEKDLELKTVKLALANHKVFKNLKTVEDLQYFMSIHIFAVWDFMSLLKRLQKDICSVSVPWMPVKLGNASRLINEIVCGEESDKLPGKNGYASHFELYLRAMKEVNADTSTIDSFINDLINGTPLSMAMNKIPSEARPFVEYTLDVAMNKTTAEVAGSFFNGREDVIPDMFSKLLEDWSISPETAPNFHYYLVRHIELDGDEHGPAGAKLIGEITQTDEVAIDKMLDCSIESVRQRIALWDRVNETLEKLHK